MRQPHRMNWNAYFNPRSREGSDLRKSSVYADSEISIHAPAKGATVKAELLQQYHPISIHAPAKGATLHIGLSAIPTLISIHAPAKGATDHNRKAWIRDCDFNPRSREGSDDSSIGEREVFFIFQSTLPRRERPQQGNKFHRIQHFNPRSREGSDDTATPCELELCNFNPRSREGSDM